MSEIWLASNREGSLEQAAEGDDGLFVAQITGVAPMFISDSGFGQVLQFSRTSKSGRAAIVIPP
jgi:hypothetical protein